MPLTEQQALDLTDGFDLITDEAQKQKATALLHEYRMSQEENGLPLFPSLLRDAEEESNKFRSMFTDLKSVDAQNPQMVSITQNSVDPEGDRMRFANVKFISRYTGKPEDEALNGYDSLMPLVAKQLFGKDVSDDKAFYSEASAHIQREQKMEKLGESAQNAALLAASDVAMTANKALAEWKASNPDATEKETAKFLSTYNDVTSKLPTVGWLGAPHLNKTKTTIQAIDAFVKGTATQEDADHLLDLPAKQRNLMIAAMFARAAEEGKKTPDGEFNTTVPGQTGKSFVRTLADMLSVNGATDDVIEQARTSMLSASVVAGEIKTSEDARKAVTEQINKLTGQRLISESTQGSPGALGVTMLMQGGETRKLTAEEKKLVSAELDRQKRGVQLSRTLTQIERTADPVKSALASGLGSSAALMGVIALPGGTAFSAVGYANSEYDKLKLENPGMSDTAARAISSASGVAQSALDKLEFNFLADKLPSVRSLIDNGLASSVIKRGVLRAGESFAFEQAQEGLQDAATPVVQGIASALSQDVPQVDWQREWAEWSGGRADVAIGTLPLTLIGMGVAGHKDIKDSHAQLRNVEAMRQLGVQDTDIVKISEAKSDEEKVAALQEAYTRRDPQVAQAAGASAEKVTQIEADKRLQELVDKGVMPKFTRNSEGWAVETPDGSVHKAATWDEARNIATQHFADVQNQDIDAVGLLADHFLSQDVGVTESVSVSGQERTTTQDVQEGVITEQQARDNAITAGMLYGLSQEQAVEQMKAVLGRNLVDMQNLVAQSASQLWKGSNVLTLTEEVVEGRWKAWVSDPTKGAARLAETRRWIAAAEQATGMQFLHNDNVTEAVSAIVTADVLGSRKDGTRVPAGVITRGVSAAINKSASNSKFAAFLQSWRAFFKQVFQRARALTKAKAEGKLGEGHQQFIDRLLGVDQQTQHMNAVAGETMNNIKAERSKFLPKTDEDLVNMGLGNSVEWDVENRVRRSDEWFDGAYVNENARNGFAEALANGGDTLSAHGMAKEGTLTGGIRKLLNLLSNGLDMNRHGGELDTAPLVSKPGDGLIGATPNGSAYAIGPFILVARPGSNLSGNLDGLGAVLVNEAHTEITPALREAIRVIRPDVIVDSYSNAGKVTQSLVDGVVDRLLGVDQQTQHLNAVADEAANMTDGGVSVPGTSYSIGMSPQQDAEYLAAVERGDMEKAQRMVDEAALASGLVELFHGSSANEDVKIFEDRTTSSGALAMGIYMSPDIETAQNYGKTGRYWVDINLPGFAEYNKGLTLEQISRGETTPVEGKSENGAWKIENGMVEVVVRKAAQIKSADPVTYDSQGNVIPLSQRFNASSDSISYSLAPRAFHAAVDSELEKFLRDPDKRAAYFGAARLRVSKTNYVLRDVSAHMAKVAGKESEMQSTIAERQALHESRVEQLKALKKIEAPVDIAVTDGTDYTEITQEAEDIKSIKAERDLVIGGMRQDGASAEDIAKTKAEFEVRIEQAKKLEASQREADFKSDMQDAETEHLRWLQEAEKDHEAELSVLAENLQMQLETYPKGGWGDLRERNKKLIEKEKQRWDKEKSSIEAAHDLAMQAAQLKFEGKQRAAEKARNTSIDKQIEREKARWELEKQRIEFKHQLDVEKLNSNEALNKQRSDLYAVAKVLDAIVMAFPAEVRGKVGGFAPMVRLNTNAAMLKHLQSKLDKINDALEAHLLDYYTGKIKALFSSALKADKTGEAPKSKTGPETHEVLKEAYAAMKLDGFETAEKLAGLEKRIEQAESQDEVDRANMIYQFVSLFGDFDNARAAQAESAYNALKMLVAEGKENWKKKQEEMRAPRLRRAEALLAAAQKRGEANAEKRNQRGSLLLNIGSFHEVMTDLFGDIPEMREIVDNVRRASYEDVDNRYLLTEAVDAALKRISGSNSPDQLNYDLQQPTIKLSKPIATGEGPKTMVSNNEAIDFILSWGQAEGRIRMESHGFTQEFADEVRSRMSAEALQLMNFISEEYAKEWAEINPSYEKHYGVSLPRIPGYSELSAEGDRVGFRSDVVGPEGAKVRKNVSQPGFFSTRTGGSKARPMFQDALAKFLAHRKQAIYWKAFFEPAQELQSLTNSVEMRDALNNVAGKNGLETLRKFQTQFAQNGIMDASATLELTHGFNKLVGNAMSAAVLGRFSTIMMQTTQIGAALAHMPAADYAMRVGKLMTGQLNWMATIKSDFIQRRIRTMPPLVRAAMEGLGAGSPAYFRHAVERMGSVLGFSDAFFTAATYAMVKDYQMAQGTAAGLTGAELEQWATNETERAVEDTAQPILPFSRSVFELTTKDNPLGKASWPFATNARMMASLLLRAMRDSKADPGRLARASFFAFVISGIMPQILKNWWRDMRGDDDERKWTPQRLLLSSLSGIATGIPGVGMFLDEGNIFSGPARSVGAVNRLAKGEWGFDVQTAGDVEKILQAVAFLHPDAAAVSSMSHLPTDLIKIIDNILKN